MKKFDDEALSADADLAESGVSLTFTRREGTQADPVTGAVVTTTTIFVANAVILSMPIQPGMDFAQAALIRQEHRRLIVSGVSGNPRPGDTVVMEGAVWRVVTCDPLRPAGDVTILWSVVVKR